MSRKVGTGSTPATVALTRAKIPFTVHTYTHDPAAGPFGAEAAQALGRSLGLAAKRVYKTLVVSVDGALVVALVPVSGQLDLKALAAAVGGKKAVLAERAVAERASGYVVGAISPVGQRQQHRTVLDDSAASCESVFVSGGRRGMELEIAPADLVRVTGATTASIGRSG